MELYIYETPDGTVADFRPYLDGFDHAFDVAQPLSERDPRWEKIRALYHPRTRSPCGGSLRLVGKAEVVWRELMQFPVAWDREYQAVDSE